MAESIGGLNEKTDRLLALWEILSVFTSCLIAEWVVLSFVGNSKLIGAIPVSLALVLMIFSHGERGETAKQIGFRVWPGGASTV